jgi:hypothetical protein
MDNLEQVFEIEKYQNYLSGLCGKDIDENIAARIWIRKNAELWRLHHQVVQVFEQQS